MIKLLAVLCVILCFLACNHNTEPPEETEENPTETVRPETEKSEEEGQIVLVDWIDFVKYGGQTYEGDWSVTTITKEHIGELLGYVEHTVPSLVERGYIVPDNASPFRSVGTSFYDIPAMENAIAVYDANEEVYYLYRLDE